MSGRRAILGFLIATVIAAPAGATPRHTHHRQAANGGIIVCNERGCSDRVKRPAAAVRADAMDANGNAVVVGRRPQGCPHAFCGCEASLYLFGRIRPELNLALNWMKKFPRTTAAPGMVAVRRHHVMVLMRHVDGNHWLVHDGNSGGHLTREHVVSIKGYVIVDPKAEAAAEPVQHRGRRGKMMHAADSGVLPRDANVSAY